IYLPSYLSILPKYFNTCKVRYIFYDTNITNIGIVISDNKELTNTICDARFASLSTFAANIATYAAVGIPNIITGITISIPEKPNKLNTKNINNGKIKNLTKAIIYSIILITHSLILDLDNNIPTTTMANGEVALLNRPIVELKGSGIVIENINKIKQIIIANLPGLNNLSLPKL